jgi:hypothetical protein
MLWKSKLKVGQKKKKPKFQSYFAFWKGLGHVLMN